MEKIKQEIKDYLNLIIFKLNLNLEYDIKEENNKININFEGQDAKILSYKNLKILNDIQTLLIIHLNNQKLKIELDVLNYKKIKIEKIEKLANIKAKEVLQSKKLYKFKPMNPYERRKIHLIFKDDEKLETISQGEEPNRYIVLKLKNNDNIYNIEEKNNFKKNGFSRKKSFGKQKRSLI